MEWFVDSWAVRDGLAFASNRPREDVVAAKQTVFIAVPDLDAVPVGRVSTSLWATRANFQAEFRTQDGEEIGFKRLDQVIELVRRAYLAGGIGPGPIVGGAVERPSPEGDPSDWPGGAPFDFSPPIMDGQDYLEDGLLSLGDKLGWDARSPDIADKKKRNQRFDRLGDTKSIRVLFDHLRVFGEATLVEWMHRLSRMPLDEAEFGAFLRWVRLLLSIRLWNSFNDFARFMIRIQSGKSFFLYIDQVVDPGWRWPLSVNTADPDTHEDIVFQVPCPRRTSWDSHIKTLSDKLLLATSSWHYFNANYKLPEFIPALLASLAVVAQAHESLMPPLPGAREKRLRAALTWLSAQMPQIKLPDSAEDALNDFAWQELTRS